MQIAKRPSVYPGSMHSMSETITFNSDAEMLDTFGI